MLVINSELRSLCIIFVLDIPKKKKYARYSILNDVFFIFQIDFPEVTKRKHALIDNRSDLYNLLESAQPKDKIVPPVGRNLYLIYCTDLPTAMHLCSFAT